MLKSMKLMLALMFLSVSIFAQTARLQVIHNAADPAAASVDIYVNGDRLLDNFAFRTATSFIDVPAGVTLNIGVAPGTSTSVADTLKNFAVTLEANNKYVAIANGVLNPSQFGANPGSASTGFTLFVKAAAREAANAPGNVDFFVLHGSTDAPAVDVIARNVATLVNDAPYSAITDYISVPAASYILDVTPAADNNTIVASYRADLSGLGGGAAAVFASGFLNPSANQNGPAFGIYVALPNGTVVPFTQLTTARLQVIHNAADPAAASVDVYLNGGILLDNFAFRTATPFIDAPANQIINVGVAGGNSASAADTLKNFQLKLLPGGTYVAIANGVLNPSTFASNPERRSTGFTLFINGLARETAESATSSVEFYVLHGSTDAPAVDIAARGVATLVSGAAYGDQTSYISVPAVNYTLDIYPAGSSTPLIAYNAPLSGLAGGSAVVFASGFLTPSANQNGAGFGVFAALPNGQVVGFDQTTGIKNETLVTPSTFGLGQNYPNPFNPSTTINFSVARDEFVSLKVFNIAGEEVASLVNEMIPAGSYKVDFNATSLTSGVYFYRLTAGNFVETKKMNLLK